ncbi:unnamed protein product [Tilletia controversa]|uniref:Alpha/beta hydrolase fold-3 domain-containing protein n=2 Tax=Tilletia TaxID=13289 RepID=A0A177UT65_9BASI|nr:hypothetical protein CF336_g164 [Tilletia laevis]KAE8264826.1 hypothetical protein A4X03_0g669 [Tilletia caries]CAD6922711.1 unnamed protein product [Tilletia controversa]KAE8207631.1 hypothetical protein CF335_g1005 [Tilletia laevis]CAD6891584.1 unnamed protein product [Tilletia caries]
MSSWVSVQQRPIPPGIDPRVVDAYKKASAATPRYLVPIARMLAFVTYYVPTTILLLPLWVLRAAVPFLRQHPQWSFARSISVLFSKRSLKNMTRFRMQPVAAREGGLRDRAGFLGTFLEMANFSGPGGFVKPPANSPEAARKASKGERHDVSWFDPPPLETLTGILSVRWGRPGQGHVSSDTYHGAPLVDASWAKTRTRAIWFMANADTYPRQPDSPDAPTRPVCLYFHGGAGVTLSAGDMFVGDSLSKNFSKGVGIDMFSVDYNLAPSAPYPIPIVQGLGAWIYLTRVLRYRPDQIYIGGDSFGGFCTMNLARYLRNEFRGLDGEPTQAKGSEVPKGLIMLSPQLLLQHDFPSREANQKTDIVGLWYADWGREAQMVGPNFIATNKLDLSNPWLAPVYLPPTEYAKLPPMFVTNGECEVLVDEGRELVERARKAGVPVQHHVDPLNVHDYGTLHGELPAARATYALIRKWVVQLESQPKKIDADQVGVPPRPKELEKPKVHL